jgi:hypothetical protein
MSHGPGVPTYTIELVRREVSCLVPEEFATSFERNDAAR